MSDQQNYTAIIDQDEVTKEVKDIAVKYDPINRSGGEGFYVTESGDLRIEESKVMAEHKIIENKIPNNSVEIVKIPSESGKLVHQYDQNGFRLYNLPVPTKGDVIGLVGRNGIGKSTILKILGGVLTPNFGNYGSSVDRSKFSEMYSNTRISEHTKSLQNDSYVAVYKPQMVSESQINRNVTVREFLNKKERNISNLDDKLDISSILDSRISELSGGERQRMYLGSMLLEDADAYLIDEPSSFLDIKQRFKIARSIREHVSNNNARCIVVEHDMAVLDTISDYIHVVYGEPSNFGVTSSRMTTKQGINDYIRGYLNRDEIQIRSEMIKFSNTGNKNETNLGDHYFDYPRITKTFDNFELEIESGTIHENEVVGIVGKNALGKTTFAKLLSGEIQPDNTTISLDKKFSYKPQYPQTSSSRTVREIFSRITDTKNSDFRNQVYSPLNLDSIFDEKLNSLSGGQIQRVSIGICLANKADVYVIDEPSAYLDVESRENVAKVLRRFARNSSKPVMVIDHDMFVIDRIADRVINFTGKSEYRGYANSPKQTRDGLDNFLSNLGITFRREPDTDRPRANKKGSQLDREQKRDSEYY